MNRWQTIKQRILKRDKNTCQRCGQRSLNVYHRVPRCEITRDELHYGPDNLITLCKDCHEYVKTHRAYGHRAGFSVQSWYPPELMPVDTIAGQVRLLRNGRVMETGGSS